MTTREIFDLAASVCLIVFMSAMTFGLFSLSKGLRNLTKFVIELSEKQSKGIKVELEVAGAERVTPELIEAARLLLGRRLAQWPPGCAIPSAGIPTIADGSVLFNAKDVERLRNALASLPSADPTSPN